MSKTKEKKNGAELAEELVNKMLKEGYEEEYARTKAYSEYRIELDLDLDK